MKFINIPDEIIEAVISATKAGFSMAGVEPQPIGVSSLSPRSQDISVVIGMVGKRNGTLTMCMSKTAAIYLSGCFAGTEEVAQGAQVTHETFDAIGEINNMIAGRLKGGPINERYGISHISCPSVIIGGDYQLYHFQGFETVSIEFSLPKLKTIVLRERFFTVTLSMTRT